MVNDIFAEQEQLLIRGYIQSLKQLLRDIQQYGIIYLQGTDRVDRGFELQQCNAYLLVFEQFINIFPIPSTWVNIYAILVNAKIDPIQCLFTCLDRLEKLTNHITIAINSYKSDNTIALYNAALQHRLLRNTLLRVTNELLCNNQYGTLFHMLSLIDVYTSFYGLQPIKTLKATLQNRQQLCLIARIMDMELTVNDRLFNSQLNNQR